MKTIGTVLLVLAAIIGMAGPVLGAEAESGASASADWFYASQDTWAWATTDDYDEYAEAGTDGAAYGVTESWSGAEAYDEYAGAGTGGDCQGEACYTDSYAYAEEWDWTGDTDANAASNADGEYVYVDSYAYSYWGPPIISEAEGYAYVENGNAHSDAFAEAYD